ncbi:MAG TPA: ornithine cyclodeaminase family protein [Gemmatimonadales bacterium]|jgi:ornithine cyclodeaminase/alanine dehydrogenase-like protein (mu-crystallin family)
MTTLLLTKGDVRSLLTLDACIDAVEEAFAEHARGQSLGAGVLGHHLPGGGFHIKVAAGGEPPRFVAKINGNFADNDAAGLPRIQGLIVLCDARNGTPLAVMDSTLITAIRTAAATAVAARHFARADAGILTIAGCGLQSRLQVRAVSRVRLLREIFAHDTHRPRAEAFAREMAAELRIPVSVVDDLNAGTMRSDLVVTCTPSTTPILHGCDVQPGTFVAAVGADSEAKQEIDPGLLASAAVVPDLVDQAATIGDLHHAIEAGLMRRDQVRAELGAVCAGMAAGRMTEGEIVIFDSTGTALQDLAAATIVYEGALARGYGRRIDFLGESPAASNPERPLARINL